MYRYINKSKKREDMLSLLTKSQRSAIRRSVHNIRDIMLHDDADREEHINRQLDNVNWKNVSGLGPRCMWRVELESARLFSI